MSNQRLVLAAGQVIATLSTSTLRRVRSRKGSHLVYVNRNALAQLIEEVNASNPGCVDRLAQLMLDEEKKRKAIRKELS